MADDTPKKSGRTPEQQAARDARKAAKKAAAAGAAAATQTEEVAAAETTEDTTAEAAPSRKRRAADEDDGPELEIDLAASAPLSKAEARAARKRAKRGDAPLPPKQTNVESKNVEQDETTEEGKAAAAEAAAKKQPQGEFSVWIGNMSFRTNEEALRAFVERGITEMGGEAGAVTRVFLPKKPGRGGFSDNKGFAYVDLKTDALRQLALGLSERHLDGRRLLIKAGDDHKADPNARTIKALPSGPGTVPGVLAKQKHAESSTLFIGNLPFDVTEEELRDFLEGNAMEVLPTGDEEEEEEEKADEDEEMAEEGEGEEGTRKPKPAAPSKRAGAKSGLLKTRVGQFEDTGRCKGFAFWDFKEPSFAKAALLNRKNHTLRGRIKLVLQFASESATNRAGRGKRALPPREAGAGGRGGRGGMRGGGRGGFAGRPQRHFDNDGGDDGYAGRGERTAGGDDDGGYEARTRGNAPAGPSDYKSEAASAARIAAMVSGGSGGYGAGNDDYGGDNAGYAAPAPSAPKGDKRGKKWESTGRPRPGAALAMAKREKVGIVESAGSKITFD